MGTRILISYVVTLFLALFGKGLCADEPHAACPSSCEVEWQFSLPENDDRCSYACTDIHTAGSCPMAPVKFIKCIHSRHICLNNRSLTVTCRNTTHQISDLMGTIKFLVALEKLLL